MVTVIIPTRPGQSEIKAVTAARTLDYPKDKLEIIVARGNQPAVQRNAALKSAKGELIYFLDDDSLAQPDNLRRALPHFADPTVKMAGGPSLCPPDAPRIEQVFAAVLGSWLAFGPSRARYEPVGAVRATSEKELILCNQLARRDSLLEAGGFSEALYPNEENALMDELQKRGGKLIYDPGLIAYRRPRSTLKSFGRMLLNYGRGRAEQFRVNPTVGSALNFVPPLFLVYLLTLAVVWNITFATRLKHVPGYYSLPLAFYALVLILQGIVLARHRGFVRSMCAVPLIVLTHLLYGVGFLRGLFTQLMKPGEKPTTAVSLEILSP
jgi:cellulose synthase/poly-beta-1,6-N-acetylglucosamine synthase-like glycosyltransferase